MASETRIKYHSILSPTPANERTIKGVLFDMDSTLVTSSLDFKLMRSKLEILPGQDIVATMRSWDGEKRAQAEKIVWDMEAEAIEKMEVYEGAHELLQYLGRSKIPHGIITRNNLHPLTHCIEKHFSAYPLSPLIHRDSPCLPKPHPDGFLFAAQQWEVDARDCMIVGDHGDDLACGRAAGGVAVLIRRHGNAAFEESADLVLDRLDDLVGYLENGFEVVR